MMRIIYLFAFLVLLYDVYSQNLKGMSNVKQNNNGFNLRVAIDKFCHGKSKNFCSKEHLEIVNKIQNDVEEKLANERRIKMKQMSMNIFNHPPFRFMKDFYPVRFL